MLADWDLIKKPRAFAEDLHFCLIPVAIAGVNAAHLSSRAFMWRTYFCAVMLRHYAKALRGAQTEHSRKKSAFATVAAFAKQRRRQTI